MMLDTNEMPTAAPETQGIDPMRLSRAYEHAATYQPLHSLLVARNGVIVSEAYFGEQRQANALNVKSVTKSVLSTLIGIALEQGLLSDVHQHLSELIPQYMASQHDERKRSLTVWHLLTMSAGLGWIENAGSLGHWHHSDDWTQFALSLPCIATPGNHFSYNTTLSHLLSVILTQVSGISTLRFAERHLFEPLGITVERWKTDPHGYNIGGSELHLTSRDMLKFGQLYLNNGMWRNQIIVPALWVKASASQQIVLRRSGFWHPAYTGYGYQWWLRSLDGHAAAVASGYGGQLVYVVPELQLVVVTTAHTDVPYSAVMQQSNRIEDIVEEYVIPSITEEH